MKNYTFLIGLAVIVCAIMAGCDIPTLNNNLREPEVPIIPSISGEVKSLNVASGGGVAHLTWTDPEDEDFDHIEISCTEPVDGFAPVTVLKNVAAADISGLEIGVVYGILVQAVNKDGNTSAGVHKIVVIGSTPPAEVANLVAVPGAGLVRLTWINPTDPDFDHLEINYSTGTGLITPLPNQARTVQELLVPSLSFGTNYAFTVRTVDTSGNKSLGSLVMASLDKVVTDLDLAQYITAPLAGVVPDTRAIVGTQYTGTLTWWASGITGSVTVPLVTGQTSAAVVQLTANPGYTFTGLDSPGKGFTYAGATRGEGVVTRANGAVAIYFPAVDRTWFVSEYGLDADNGGTTRSNTLKSVAKAVSEVKKAHALSAMTRADIVVIGTSDDTAQILIDNISNDYPPITLRGLSPTQSGILTADKTGWPYNNPVLLLKNGADVTLGNDLTITGGGKKADVVYGGGVYVRLGSTFTMNGGAITGNTAIDQSGGIQVTGASTSFIMNSGVISNNEAPNFGGALINDYATFIMTGGTITANHTTTGDAGGVRVSNFAAFTMSGGVISANYAFYDGGGVAVNSDGAFTMTGGTIVGNTAASRGGGVFTQVRGAFTLTGGTIVGNTAESNGGGVFLRNDAGTFTMNGGTIAGNTAAASGGGVGVMSGVGVFIKAPLIAGNASGIIYGNDGTANANKSTMGVDSLLNDQGHAVFITDGPKRRETTVMPDETLDSTVEGVEGGWVE